MKIMANGMESEDADDFKILEVSPSKPGAELFSSFLRYLSTVSTEKETRERSRGCRGVKTVGNEPGDFIVKEDWNESAKVSAFSESSIQTAPVEFLTTGIETLESRKTPKGRSTGPENLWKKEYLPEELIVVFGGGVRGFCRRLRVDIGRGGFVAGIKVNCDRLCCRFERTPPLMAVGHDAEFT